MPEDENSSLFDAIPRAMAALLCLALIGCAAEVIRQPVTLNPLGAHPDGPLKSVKHSELVTFNSGYERVIAKDSPWKLVGNVPQGGVYASAASVFSVEGAHVHEAYLVVARGNLVGFYLPVEKAFAPLNSVRVINLWEE